jgi:hypothetical protein
VNYYRRLVGNSSRERNGKGVFVGVLGVAFALAGIASVASPVVSAQTAPPGDEPRTAEAPAVEPPPIERIVHDEELAAIPTIGRPLQEVRPLEVTARPLTQAPVCDDGSSGNRVQAVYVRGAGQADTYNSSVEKIREAMAFSDSLVDKSVAGREMHLRMVHSGEAGCVIDVVNKVVPDSVAGDIGDITQYMTTQPGFQDPSRKYLAFAEINSPSECGIAFSWGDDSPGGGNVNNGFINIDSPASPAFHATVGQYCWNVSYDPDKPDPKALAAVHETFHMLGSVSDAAPHGTRLGHCTDENDLMCYQDEASVVLTWDNGCGVQSENSGTLTNDAPENFLLDCNDDDYFDPSRPTSGYLTDSWNTADSDFLYGNEGDRYVGLPNPRRALDTRKTSSRIGPGEIYIPLNEDLTLGIAPEATAVVLNVTAIKPTIQMNLTVWPTGLAKPLASNLNIAPGKIIANQVTVKLGSGGKLGSGSISISTNRGQTDVVVDVVGYFVKSRSGDGAELQPVTPYRVMSSRDSIGPYSSPWGQNETRAVQITGTGVPANATAVVLNVTTTQSTAPRSHLRVFPYGQQLPDTSSLNFEAYVNTPNLVTVGLGAGKINIYNHAGSVHVIADVVGYYGPSASTYVPIANVRVFDSRSSSKIGNLSRWGPNQTQVVQVGGAALIPGNATSVVLNLTGVGATANTNIRVFPASSAVPDTSNLNLIGGGVPRPNAVVAGLSADGAVGFYNYAGHVDLVADAVGYYIPS